MSQRLFLGLIAVTFLTIPGCSKGGGGSTADAGPDSSVIPPAPDEDEDGISDEIEGRDENIDTDGDGTPDYQDDDSDSDLILDIHEGSMDPDGDGVPNFRDLNSDQDCGGRTDMIEAGDTDLLTAPIDSDGDQTADAYDLDADNDGLSDKIEDANCDGVVDAAETDPLNDDTDGDGASDLIEVAAQTDPLDSSDNPQAYGNFVFVVPYNEPTEPERDDLDFSTNLKDVDLYFLFDRSGSISAEVTDIRDNVVTVLSNLTCPPLGTGDLETCIPNLWAGAGTIGYPGSGGESYTHLLDVQPNPQMLQNALTDTMLDEPGCSSQNPDRPCDEVTHLAMWSAMTGMGSQAAEASYSCDILEDYPADTSCPEGIGYACFRPDALPVVLFATDESSAVHNNCPAMSDVIDAANSIGAKIVGVAGSNSQSNMFNEMEAFAESTQAVDFTQTPAQPIVIDAGDQPAQQLENGIRILANGVPLNLSALAHDDPNDPVEAVTAFIDRLETQQLGTEQCSAKLEEIDSNGDGAPDQYVSVLAGTPVCWSLVPKMNTTVEPIAEGPQIFRATIEVKGNDITTLDTRDVYFLVPPTIMSEPVD